MATKRKQRQPNEDLEAAVAEILDNPIVKINLGFLNVGKPGGEDVSIGAGEEDFPGEYTPEPMGLGAYPVGIRPGDAEAAESNPHLSVPNGRRPSESSQGPDSFEFPKPMGVDVYAMGRVLKPEGVREPVRQATGNDSDIAEGLLVSYTASPKRIEGSQSLSLMDVEPDIKPIGRESTPMGYGVYPMCVGTSQSMFLAEQLGTLFPVARVHRIRLAQDALSHVEEKVYDLLWGVKNQSRDSYRLSEFSLQRIANEGRLNIKTVRELLPRLIDKGFIAIEREADVRRNRPTQYRVWSYSEVLADQRRKDRLWFVKTGKGVFYARPVSVGVTRDEVRAEDPEPMGGDRKPEGLETGAGGVILKPVGVDLQPMGVVAGPVGVDDISQDFLAELSGCIRTGLGMAPDEPLLTALVEECRQRARLTDGEPASDEEILQFTEMKIRVLRHASKLRNPLAVLKRAVPECFIGQPLVEYRAAERGRKRREMEELRRYENSLHEQDEESRAEIERLSGWERISGRHRTAQGYDLRAIAEDPELDEHGRAVAVERMRRLGRFAPRGL